MQSITELGPVRTADFKKAIRKSDKQAKIARKLMLDLLAAAYSSETLIHAVYYDRANEVLQNANTKLMADKLHAAIMKEIS